MRPWHAAGLTAIGSQWRPMPHARDHILLDHRASGPVTPGATGVTIDPFRYFRLA
jgi:hypothetical protein